MKNILLLVGLFVISFAPCHATFVLSYQAITKGGGVLVQAFDEDIPLDPQLIRTTTQAIVQEPHDFLILGQNTRDHMKNFDYPNAQEIVRILAIESQSNPCFLFDECRVPLCPLTRSQNAQSHRSIFKDELSQRFHMLKNKDEGINIIFYASGNLFFEASLLVSLIEHNIKINSIKLVDLNWGVFFHYFPPVKKDITIDDFNQLLNYQNNAPIMRLLQESYRLKQFLDVIEVHSGHRPPLFIYPHARALITDQQEKSHEVSLLVASDFIDAQNTFIQAHKEVFDIFNTLAKGSMAATLFSHEGSVESHIFQRGEHNSIMFLYKSYQPKGSQYRDE